MSKKCKVYIRRIKLILHLYLDNLYNCDVLSLQMDSVLALCSCLPVSNKWRDCSVSHCLPLPVTLNDLQSHIVHLKPIFLVVLVGREFVFAKNQQDHLPVSIYCISVQHTNSRLKWTIWLWMWGLVECRWPNFRLPQSKYTLEDTMQVYDANAQRDGRPAEYRWRPLLNAAVWLTPTTRVPCSNAAKMWNPLKLHGVPQTNKTI